MAIGLDSAVGCDRSRYTHLLFRAGTPVVITNEFNFRSRDGLLLSGQFWRTSGEPRGTLVLVHGYASHMGRFKKFASSLADQGFVVYSFDWRGHGKSEGLRAYIPSLRMWLSDFERFMEHVPVGHRLFLIGQGLGASLGIYGLSAGSKQFHGTVLLGPGLRRAYAMNPVTFVGHRVGSLLLPSADWSDGVFRWKTSRMFRHSGDARDFLDDPFVYHGRFRNRTARVMDKSLRLAMRRAPAIDIPYLLLQGQADQLFDVKGAQAFHAIAKVKDKTLKILPDAGHDLLYDKERARVYTTILTWLKKHTK